MGYYKRLAIDIAEAARVKWVSLSPDVRQQINSDFAEIYPDHRRILEHFSGPDHVVRAPDYNVCGPDCIGCGGLGYTVEQSEDGECTVGCREGWERAMDRAAVEEYFS